jgi:transketolase C-terminal domain/subunit
MPVVTLENHVLRGGLADVAAGLMARVPRHKGLLARGWPADTVLPWGPESGVRKQFRLDAPALADDIAAFVRQPR